MSRAIDAFLNGRLLFGLVTTVVISAAFAPQVARRLRIARPLAYLAVLTAMLIVAITILERIEGAPGFDPGRALTWWTQSRQSVVDVARTEPAWWLNVALFVPAGLAWAAATRRPVRVVVGLAAFSFLIETVQGLMGLGAADQTDLAANILGGLVGAAAVGFVLRVSPQTVWRISEPPSDLDACGFDARWIAASIAATLIVSGLSYGAVQVVLSVRQEGLRDDVEQTYDGLTVQDVNGIRDPDAVGLDPFFVLDAGPPDSYQFYGDDRPVEIRYTIDFLGFYRCVFVTLSSSPPVFASASGETCTEDRYAD